MSQTPCSCTQNRKDYQIEFCPLHAAALELLEAAKGLLNGQGHLPECERVYCEITCKAIRTAIAKAEGRA